MFLKLNVVELPRLGTSYVGLQPDCKAFSCSCFLLFLPGYGNLSPSTVAGQIFCVFYALFGVPLNLAFLNQLGKILNAHLITLERWVQKPGRAQVQRQSIIYSHYFETN